MNVSQREKTYKGSLNPHRTVYPRRDVEICQSQLKKNVFRIDRRLLLLPKVSQSHGLWIQEISVPCWFIIFYFAYIVVIMLKYIFVNYSIEYIL